MNNVPSMEYSDGDGNPIIIPALLPLVDFANYESNKKNSAKMLFDGATKSIQLQLNKGVKKGEEIFLNYGHRSNGDFLLHNGFVPSETNVGNSYEIKFGNLTLNNLSD
jgi:histone-lysine N-methyltransferase SETD3